MRILDYYLVSINSDIKNNVEMLNNRHCSIMIPSICISHTPVETMIAHSRDFKILVHYNTSIIAFHLPRFSVLLVQDYSLVHMDSRRHAIGPFSVSVSHMALFSVWSVSSSFIRSHSSILMPFLLLVVPLLVGEVIFCFLLV